MPSTGGRSRKDRGSAGGAGPALALLHGASGSWTHWLRNIPALAERFTVLVPDMPGFGDSDDLPEPHTAERLADAVAAGLRALVPPPAEIRLAGFSPRRARCTAPICAR